jgi:hypothetical protein
MCVLFTYIQYLISGYYYLFINEKQKRSRSEDTKNKDYNLEDRQGAKDSYFKYKEGGKGSYFEDREDGIGSTNIINVLEN